jgi:hypothetical protein
MNKRLLLIALALTIANGCFAEEITLFDASGSPTAYIDTADSLTIFTWDGKPAAYLLSKGSNTYNIYGFTGNHLGWLKGGIIRDHGGNAVGFIKGAVNMITQYEPYKGYKQYTPYKAYTEHEPYMPYLSKSWSSTPLSLFLLQGDE